MNQLTRLLLDIGPLAAFFVAYNQADIMIATGVFMVAVVAALGTGYAIERRIAKMPLVTAVVVLVFWRFFLGLAIGAFWLVVVLGVGFIIAQKLGYLA